MFTKRDKEVIKKIREGKWHFTGLLVQHVKDILFEECCSKESHRILWRMVNGKKVTDEEIRYWWRAHKNEKNEFHYTKWWKNGRQKMVNYHPRYDMYIHYYDGKKILFK